jgi:hypothetical protein
MVIPNWVREFVYSKLIRYGARPEESTPHKSKGTHWNSLLYIVINFLTANFVLQKGFTLNTRKIYRLLIRISMDVGYFMMLYQLSRSRTAQWCTGGYDHGLSLRSSSINALRKHHKILKVATLRLIRDMKEGCTELLHGVQCKTWYRSVLTILHVFWFIVFYLIARDRVRWRAFVSTVMNLRIP